MATTVRTSKAAVTASKKSQASVGDTQASQEFLRILAGIEGLIGKGNGLFPGGINKIQFELKLAGDTGLSVTIEGAGGEEGGQLSALMMTDPAIESLGLNRIAKEGAYELKAAHPEVVFTSGIRSVPDQARVMADNVVANRNYIKNTYSASTLRTKLQKWVDDNPSQTTSAQIAAGLESVFNAAPASEVAAFSKHLSGDAFDVQPVTTNADAIKKTIRALKGLTKFLEIEGGLVRWHAEF